jgi:hypothetical protein
METNYILDKNIPSHDPIKTKCFNNKLISKYPDLKFTSIENGIENILEWYLKFK